MIIINFFFVFCRNLNVDADLSIVNSLCPEKSPTKSNANTDLMLLLFFITGNFISRYKVCVWE